MAKSVCLLSMDLEDFKHATCTNTGLAHLSDPGRTAAGVEALLEVLNAAAGDKRITIFTTGQVARNQPGLVARLAAAGHEIGCHTDQHENVDSLNRETFAANLDRAVKSLEDASGQKIAGFRAPNFSMPSDFRWAFDALAEKGFQYDSSIVQDTRRTAAAASDAYSVSGDNLYEFPIYRRPLPGGFGVRVIGGTYFRLLPAHAILTLMRTAADMGYMPLIYLHPADLDDDFEGLAWREMHPLGRLSRLKLMLQQQYWAAGTGQSASRKLATVLRTFANAGPMAEALASGLTTNGSRAHAGINDPSPVIMDPVGGV